MADHCGQCGLCCKLMGVTELKKPQGEWCRHLHHGDFNMKSCTIYSERPPPCRSFECLWLSSQSRPSQRYQTAMRPDNSHVVLVMDIFAIHDIDRNERILFAHCDPLYPHAWRQGLIKQAIETFLKRGGTVLVLIGEWRALKRPGGGWVFGKQADIEVAMAQIPAPTVPPPSPRTETALPKMYGVPGGGRPADATFNVPELMRRR